MQDRASLLLKPLQAPPVLGSVPLQSSRAGGAILFSCALSECPLAVFVITKNSRNTAKLEGRETVVKTPLGRAWRAPQVRPPVTGPGGQRTGRRRKHLTEVGPGQAAFDIKAHVLFCLTLTEKEKRSETEFSVIFFFQCK